MDLADYDHVPFVQGMTLQPHTVAYATFITPAGFFDHPIPKWMSEHPGQGYPSRRQGRRIMRAARKAGWDPKPHDDAVRQMQET